MKKVLGATILAVAVATMIPAMYAADFVKPSKEELAMTSMPGYPNAAAVVLYKEEISRDDMHVHQFYQRIKILTEKGKDYANVELGYATFLGNDEYEGNDVTVGDILGRTIHPDGTIIPFTGKPYLKTVEKTKGYKVQQKVFTLPDAEVGSIIEYRYTRRYSDHYFDPPDWYIQGELYVKAAHFVWYPTTQDLVAGEKHELVNSISWFPILPPGVQIQHRDLPGNQPNGRTAQIYELTIKDVPPTEKEEFMPPIASFSYRVLYNFSQYRSGAEYWKDEGKQWSKRIDKFAGPNNELTSATASIVEGATTQEQKLRKIYAKVMTLENTDYTRSHERQEDKAEGLGKVENAADVLSHKRGSGRQLTLLFVGMARAAGMKAYVATVADRSERIFTPQWMNFSQLGDLVAIVNVDGKDQFFDPGTRYCPYGSLTWQDTMAQGIRQVDGGTDIVRTPLEQYNANTVTRVGELTMADDGSVKGTVDFTYRGAPAMHWRGVALREDEESFKNRLKESLEESLPKTLEVRVKDVKNFEDYEKPLAVTYEVKGSLGTATGKRLVIPAELFQSGSSATFPHDKRDLAVYFHYPENMQDAWRLKFPSTFALEGSPEPAKYEIKGTAAYSMSTVPAATSIIVRRNYAFNGIITPPDHYGELRTFYSQFEAKDHESIVLKVVQPAGATASNGGVQ